MPSRRLDLGIAWLAPLPLLVAIAWYSHQNALWCALVTWAMGAAIEMASGRETNLPTRDSGRRQIWGAQLVFVLVLSAQAAGIPPVRLPLAVGAGLGGLALLGASWLRIRARRDLNGGFRYALALTPGQILVTSGIYARLRHPAYLGAHLFMAAVPLTAGNPMGLVVSALLLPSTWARIRREDQMLEAAYGEPFRAWKSRTPSLFPRLTAGR